MPSLVVPNGAQLRLIWGLSGVPSAVNVFGVSNVGAVAINQALANSLGTAVKGAFGSSAHNNNVSTLVTLISVGIRNVNIANQAEFLDSDIPVAGNEAGNLLPLNVSLCLTLRTAMAGRSYRGRAYMWGFTETNNTATGTAAATVATTSIAFVNAIQDALQAAAMDLGVLSRANPDVTPAKTAWVTPVTSVASRDLVWETQRRRSHPGI